MSYTLSFEDEEACDFLVSGGKGACLADLYRSGFNVPEGFCITTAAFDLFMKTYALREKISSVLASVDFTSPHSVEAAASKIKGYFENYPMPEEVEEAIVSSYQKLISGVAPPAVIHIVGHEQGQKNIPPVAVRSSAVTKDSSRSSFPGQLDTYHNLRGVDEVLKAVARCWASAFNYRSIMNRKIDGIDPLDVLVAPVVQMMVFPDSSGVAFSINPVDGNRNLIVIESTFGLGVGVVSGRFNTDQFAVDRKTGNIVEWNLSPKKEICVCSVEDESGVFIKALSEEDALKPSLSDEEILKVGELATCLEDRYGCPQDVEWAIAEGVLYVLQSRPVTGVPTREVRGVEGEQEKEVEEEFAPDEWVSEFDSTVDPEYPLYTLSNISEVLPGVLTPLTLSGIDHLDKGFVETNRRFGLMKGISPKSQYTFLGVFYNRVHLNLSVVKKLTSRIPGASAQEFERMLPAQSAPEERYKWSARGVLGLISPLVRIIYWMLSTPGEAAKLRREIDERVGGESGRDIEILDYGEFLRVIDESSRFREEVITFHITASQFAVVFHDFLRKALAGWIEGGSDTLASSLLTGLSNIESVGPLTGIWQLSRIVKGSAELSRIFEREDTQEIIERISASDSPDASRFRMTLEGFLEKYGYRSVLEAELALPNWEDDPSFVISTIKNYLEVSPDYNPDVLLERQRLERERAKSEALSGLSFFKKLLFLFLLREAQRYVSLREFTKATLIKGIARLKKYFHALGRLMCSDGIIEDPGDIFFLTMDEVKEIAARAQHLKSGGPEGYLKAYITARHEGSDYAGSREVFGRGDISGEVALLGKPFEQVIRRRKLEYERNKKVQLPECSFGRPKPVKRDSKAGGEEGEARILRGIAVASGRASGKARIIMDPRQSSSREPGEVLVVPVTDAAWTPLFVGASALVVDVGGPLSHGSIVARELGIPAVVNVIEGTRVIRDGDLVTVDGNSGEVYVRPRTGG